MTELTTRLRLSSRLRFASMEMPDPVLEDSVLTKVTGFEGSTNPLKRQYEERATPGLEDRTSLLDEPYNSLSVLVEETPALVRKAFGSWPHLVLEVAPQSLIPDAKRLLETFGENAAIPRVIVLPRDTDLRKYAEERRLLSGPGIAVVCMGSPELKSILQQHGR